MENTAQNNKIEYELEPSTREKMSFAKKGANNPNYGRPRDEITKQKISQSQTKRHAQIRAFNEIIKMSATRRTWPKTRYEGFSEYRLIDCHDVCALYRILDLKSNMLTPRRRVYFFVNGIEGRRDFDDERSAREFMDAYRNPDVEFLMSESKTTVVVMGLLKG